MPENKNELSGLNELARDIHENAKAHGWWDENRSFPEVIALCHSELSEALEEYRRSRLATAKRLGIKTWVSCEPVIYEDAIYSLIAEHGYIDAYKIGKLNYHTPEEYGAPPINWGEFGRNCERLCIEHGRNYYIKEDLRAAMAAGR